MNANSVRLLRKMNKPFLTLNASREVDVAHETSREPIILANGNVDGLVFRLDFEIVLPRVPNPAEI